MNSSNKNKMHQAGAMALTKPAISIRFLTIALTAFAFSAAGQSIPKFLTPTNYPVAGASMAAVGDFNGDGILDIVTANGGFVLNAVGGVDPVGQGVSLLLGNTNGTFQAARSIVGGSHPNYVAVGDFNGDGKLDVVVANGTGTTTVSILLGNGDGTFQPAIDTVVGGLGATKVIAKDFNGDGKLDLAVVVGVLSTPTLTTSNVSVLLGTGSGTFNVSYTTPGFRVLAADFNNDGKQDLIVDATVRLGSGDGTFLNGQTLAFTPNLAVTGDFDGDGNLDIYAYTGGSTRSGAIQYMVYGLGDGTFTPLIVGCCGGPVSNVVAADFNGDGNLDLGTFPGVVFGTGGRPSFSGIQAPLGFGRSVNGSFVAVGDFDRNGAPDMIMANGSAILVALNTGGNPPLLAQETLTAGFVVGGATTVTGTVSLGAPAQAGGASITLASSDPAAFFPGGNAIIIPTGSTTAAFNISTVTVAASTPVVISATSQWNTFSLNANFTVVPSIAVASVSISPASIFGMFGGNQGLGTVTLSGPASDGVIVTLTSSNPAIVTVPPSVPIAPGTTTATFPISASNVAANTVITVSASYQGTTSIGTVTVLKATDTVAVTKAEYVVSKSQFKLEASTTDNTVLFLRVFNATTGAYLGYMSPAGGGKFIGSFLAFGPLTSVLVQSPKGGLVTAPVAQR